jgi:hypothetical protein
MVLDGLQHQVQQRFTYVIEIFIELQLFQLERQLLFVFVVEDAVGEGEDVLLLVRGSQSYYVGFAGF